MAKSLALSKASFFQLIFCFNRIALPPSISGKEIFPTKNSSA
ncbi:hypothetical protein [Paenibacillus chitinolyticus]|nr:hypothetical protein [Paenibacillus chitinolyticus]